MFSLALVLDIWYIYIYRCRYRLYIYRYIYRYIYICIYIYDLYDIMYCSRYRSISAFGATSVSAQELSCSLWPRASFQRGSCPLFRPGSKDWGKWDVLQNWTHSVTLGMGSLWYLVVEVDDHGKCMGISLEIRVYRLTTHVSCSGGEQTEFGLAHMESRQTC